MAGRAKDSMWYAVWHWYMKRCMDLFYRRIEVQGKDNIPLDKPILFASNHTNALMDPLVISCHSGIQHYFMTRGDVFKKKLIGDLFRSWRMLPIFRMKDGIETLAQNNPVMDFVIDRLKNGYSIIIFAEGSHFWNQTVQPLKKGLVRIAFEVLNQDPNTELVVVPVGLHYNDMVRTNQDALVSFGKPISVKNFPKEESEQKTYLQFNKQLREKMKELIVNIEPGELAEKKNQLRKELESSLLYLEVKDSFKLQQKLIQLMDRLEAEDPTKLASVANLDDLTEAIGEDKMEELNQARYNKPGGDNLFYFLKLPLYILASINFILVFLVGKKLLSGVKDRTFHNSIKFGLAMVVAPIFAMIQGGILAVVLGSFWYFVLYLALMPVWGALFSEFTGRRKLVL
ncbi:MAG: hypothetical protein EP332_11430 [Bacteroidetes bacterium]|nr:MAG: hypothetical protein EP332_11430 [Bacteroidota bacterium]